jgi:hypothetical protein
MNRVYPLLFSIGESTRSSYRSWRPPCQLVSRLGIACPKFAALLKFSFPCAVALRPRALFCLELAPSRAFPVAIYRHAAGGLCFLQCHIARFNEAFRHLVLTRLGSLWVSLAHALTISNDPGISIHFV